jgi:hypothetical protein
LRIVAGHASVAAMAVAHRLIRWSWQIQPSLHCPHIAIAVSAGDYPFGKPRHC